MKVQKKHISVILCSFLLASSSLFAEDKKETTKLDSVTVIDSTVSNYQTLGKTKIDRSNVDLEDSAKLIHVFNEDFLFDYQPQSLTDIVSMASNVTFGGDSHGRNNIYMMRGFSHAPILRDGFNLSNAIANTEMYNIERVEILKGPGSLQYGDSNPGGLINLVKKKPTKDAIANVEFEVTSDPSFSPKVDLGGALNEDGSLRYRLVSSYMHKEDYRDFNVDHKRVFLSPSLAYDLNENNTVTFTAEYLDETTPADFGTYITDSGKVLTDRNTVTTHPDQEFKKEQKIVGFDFQSNYDSWNSNFKYRYVTLKRDNDAVYAPNYRNGTLTRSFATQHFDSKEHIAQYTINKDFKVMDFKNKLSLGLDAKKSEIENHGFYALRSSFVLDPSNVNYGSNSTRSDYNVGYDYIDLNSTVKSYGAFLQDHIYLTNDLILSLGLRYQKTDTDYNKKTHDYFTNTYTGTYNSSSDHEASTPQLGIVYKYSPQTTFYANYAETFNTQDLSYTDSNGNLLEPEEGKGYEIGVKQKLFNDEFTLTTALFNIEKTNVARLIGKTVPFFTYETSEKMKSKGLEIDLAGKITPNWSVIASYGYTKSEDVEYDNNQFAGVPKHTANIFTTYDLSRAGLKNFYIGGGARYIGSRYADSANDIKIDSDIIYNTMLGYKKDNWRVNFTIKNLLDEEYVEFSGTSSASYGQRRTAILTMNYSF